MISEIILTGIIIVQAVLHYTERKDLYNRIMSKDYTEYSSQNHSPDAAPKSKHRRIAERWNEKRDNRWD